MHKSCSVVFVSCQRKEEEEKEFYFILFLLLEKKKKEAKDQEFVNFSPNLSIAVPVLDGIFKLFQQIAANAAQLFAVVDLNAKTETKN